MSKSTLSILSSVLLSTAALTTPAVASSQPHSPGKYSGLPHYVLFDVGSFGGGLSGFCYPNCRQLNRKGEAVGINTTSIPDPLDPLCFIDCNVDPAFDWKNGGTNALLSINGTYAAWSQGISDKGESAGFSENGAIDQDIGIFQGRAALWKNGKVKDLGTLGGTQSNAWMVNNSGEVVADASTADTNDPYLNVPQANCKWLPTTGPDCGGLDFATNTLFLPVTTTMHGASWTKSGGLADIGTLGGPDSSALDINDAGQIVGWSYTSYQAGSSGVPDTQAFVWDAVHGMKALPGLGGTFSAATQINKNGQITGVANTAGDAELHSVVWDASGVVHDRGTLGSDYGHPDWMNDKADIVGFSRTSDQAGRAFVYWHDGDHPIDLGTIDDDPESEATGINNNGMIIGITFERGVGDLKGWISDNGGPITDLNTLIRKPHGIHVFTSNAINDRGVIAAQGELKNGEQHAVLLVPENDLDMLEQMQAAVNVASRQAGTSARAQGPHAARRNCRGERRMRLHFCMGG